MQAPSIDENEDDAEIREQVHEIRAKTLQIRVTGYESYKGVLNEIFGSYT